MLQFLLVYTQSIYALWEKIQHFPHVSGKKKMQDNTVQSIKLYHEKTFFALQKKMVEAFPCFRNNIAA